MNKSFLIKPSLGIIQEIQRRYVIPRQIVLWIDAIRDDGPVGTITNLACGKTIDLPSGWSKDGNAFTTSEECGLDFGYSNKKIFGENETTKETGFTIEYVFNQAQEKKLCPGGYKYPISQMVSAHRWNEIAGEMTVEDGIVNINTNRYSGKVYHLENYTVPLNKNVSIAMSLSPYADGKHVAKFYVNGQLKQINNVKYPIESTNCTICNDCYMRVNQLNYYTTNASFVGKLYAVRYSFAVLSDRAIYRNFRVDARKYGIEVQ